jgi:hypothetical protein
MDDISFIPRSAKRVDRERPPGLFGREEVLPKPVSDWKSKVDPLTQKKRELLDFAWQRVAAQRILESLELHTYEWTIKQLKTRERLDKQDNRDKAQATFAMDRERSLISKGKVLRAITTARDGDDEVQTAAAVLSTLAAKRKAIDDYIDDGHVEEDGRATVVSHIEMTGNEWDILAKFVVVYEKARSHFLFEIVEEKVKRHFNAERIRADATGTKPLKYPDYKELLLARRVNSAQTEDLLSYILKPRDEGCPVGLWVAERMSEMKLCVNG